MRGVITTIQRMSISDGPGIRSTLFMKGCNLRCKWCHNPETWSMTPQIEYIESKCLKCGKCTQNCPVGNYHLLNSRLAISRTHCSLCGECVNNCPAEALRILGKSVDVDWVITQFKRDELFFKNSGGGVTVSGGEPFFQYDFIKELFTACKTYGFDTAIETNLTTDKYKIESLLPYIDHWMCDLKMINNDLHRQWTGVANDQILDNIKYLSSHAQLTVRTPVIPGVNDTVEELRKIKCFIESLHHDIKHDFLEFHQLGYCKFDQLGMKNPMPTEIKPFKKNEFNNLINLL